jgi:sec-independent protein translocase protein TatB
MFGFGMSEVLFILFLALLLLGPKQLPEVARTLGRLVTEARRYFNTLSADMNSSTLADLKKTMNQVTEVTPKPTSTPSSQVDRHKSENQG